MATLQTVNKLTVTFLVDNTIEWFTRLPPGFTHELPEHLRAGIVDEVTKVPAINFDKICCGAHGFSALIETEGPDGTPYLTLFDTGPDNTTLNRNVEALRIPVERISRVVTSHWHSDHTGGLLSFLDHRSRTKAEQCIVDVHPDRPLARGIASGPNYDKVVGMLPYDPSFEAIERLGGLVEKHDEGHAVAGNTVYVSGEIPRVTPFEVGILGGMRFRDGKWDSEQHIMDERYVVINVSGRGLVIFSACSHAGIVNVVKDAMSKFPGRPVYSIIGGLHLAPPDCEPTIEPTVRFLTKELRPAPTYILPMHCSGFNCKIALEKELGEGIVPAGVGMRFSVPER